MKKLFLTTLLIGMISPIQPAEAVGCAQVKTMIKSMGSASSFSNAKSAKKMVDAYEIAFKNSKCPL